MGGIKHTEEQIAFALRQVESGTPVGEVCRFLGIGESTFSIWRMKYGGLGVAELRRLRQLEEEHHKQGPLVAALSLDLAKLQEVIATTL